MCAKGAKRPNGASLGTPDAWKPGTQLTGAWLSWRSVDTVAVGPWPGYPQTPPTTPRDVIRPQGARANVPPEVLEELDEAMVGEPQGRCRLPSQWARTQQLGTLDRVRQLRPY